MSSQTASNVLGFINKLRNPEIRKGLYQDPLTALAIFRTLPSLGKNIIMRMLYLQEGIPKAMIESWWTDPVSAEKRITDLGLLEKDSQGLYKINKDFRKALQTAIAGEIDSSTTAAPFSNNQVDRKKLENQIKNWEKLLAFLLAPNESGSYRGSWWYDLLEPAKLLKRARDGEIKLSRAGFQFLLKSSTAQVWDIMIEYFKQQPEENLTEKISFLFQICLATLGKAYYLSGLTEAQREMVNALNDIGLVYKTSDSYIPTSLATNLVAGLSDIQNTDHRQYIVVETNMRVYAYTDSTLEISLLNLFITLTHRFQNMVVGILSRESIRPAFKQGITAKQIIQYLNCHAHPNMREKEPPLPDTISHAIELWEHERNRMTRHRGVLFSEFRDLEEFHSYSKHVKSEILFQDEKKLQLVTTAEGYEILKKAKRGNR